MTHHAPAAPARLIVFGAPRIPRAVGTTVLPRSRAAEQGVWLYLEDRATNAKFGYWEAHASRFCVTMDGYTEFCHIR